MASSNVTADKKGGKVKGFFKGVLAELKKVHWPNKKQVINYTCIVLVCLFAMAIAIYLVDLVLDFLLGFIIK